MNMKFEMRSLKSSDMFTMFGILSKIGFTDIKDKLNPERIKEFAATFNQNNEETTDEQFSYIGFNVIMEVVEIVMKNLPKCEKEIYKFLSDLTGKTAKEIENLDIATFTEMVIAVIKKDEFKDFFKVVSGLFKPEN